MTRSFFLVLPLFLVVLLSCSTLNSQTITLDSTVLTEREVAIGIEVPWEILWGPDDHIWATERRGRVLRINPENGNIQTLLNIQSQVWNNGGEPGLLGMALHPDFLNTPVVFLVYNYIVGNNIRERLVSFDWTGANLTNETILLNNIPGGNIHNGSRLLITTDNKILMTTGDTGDQNLSQSLFSLNGKVLRLELDGSVPQDNPINGSYIYSYGHRNPQGLAYGPNGQIYSSEHGASTSDEFNMIEPNRNYGWPDVQGTCNTPSEISFCNSNNVREPLDEWTPCVAVNGLAYFEHPAIPEWKGKMLMAVLGGFAQDPRLSVLSFNGDGTEVLGEEKYFTSFGRIRDVCINPHNGAVYFATNGNFYPSFGPNELIEYRNLDYIVTSTNNPTAKDQFVEVFPNPVKGNANLRFSDNFIGFEYELISYAGQIVKKASINNTSMILKAHDLPAGNYYLKATNKLGTITRTVIIQ